MPNDHAQERPLWGSRVRAPLTRVALELSSSTDVDRPLAVHDIAVTRAHLHELERIGLLDADGRSKLDGALASVAAAIEDATFAWSEEH